MYITLYCDSHALCASSCLYALSLMCTLVTDIYLGPMCASVCELCIMILIGFLESAIYNVEIKFCKSTASPFTLPYTVQVLCAICNYLCTLTHVYMLFPVWRSAPVHTDCQSNALTPSICSTVTTSMDVMSYIYGCKLSMLLVL